MEEIVPTAGFKNHVTGPVEFVTVAVNCAVCPGPTDAEAGVTEIDGGGWSVTVADADRVPSETLVAVTLTVFELVTVAGAVYNPPALMLPTAGAMLQTTPAVEFVTVAVNCCV